MSSAYIKQSSCWECNLTESIQLCKYDGRSLIKILKRLGLQLSPCRTPNLIGKETVSKSPVLTQASLFEYILLITFCML
jgi:hypothetical protein